MSRISIITPTHVVSHLGDCYSSLCRQTMQDFEWVLIPNNGAVIPAHIAADARVVVWPHDSTSVGALKLFACQQASGDVFVELDHDDILSPTALDKIAAAATDYGFVYSDCAEFNHDGSYRKPYSPRFGWQYYDIASRDFPVEVRSRSIQAMRTFPLTAASLSRIFWAPNHVRAWRRDAYEAVGGHAPMLEVCDDYELVCRTYLGGVSFGHIPECLYFYRVHPGNTVRARNRIIQTQQADIGNRLLRAITLEWCRRQNLRTAELDRLYAVLPYENNSAGYVSTDGLLQQLSSSGEIVQLWNELYRVLAPGGLVFVDVPYGAGTSQWTERSLRCFTERAFAAKLPGLCCRFQLVTCYKVGDPPRLLAALSALKGQRQPGLCGI